ncbi:drug resistance protein [Glonium stellatum]|uniref:Drug resistance protein n=1 Tax=Glonium stellatum TaxID=574774 RepID=A0A8E2JZ87_9PEZI|nr:drug resistance protein [Glonium stellatum]
MLEDEDNEAELELGAPQRPALSKTRLIALVITVTGAAFLNTLGVQAAVIVLPTIGKDLGIPDSRQQWIVSAYSLTFGCFLLLWGRLADVYGKRFIFIWGSAWVTATTIVIPFVNNEIGFDVLRGLQGLGAAANVPTAIGILGVTFAPGKAKNYAFSCYGAGAPMGSIFGNLLGGVIGEYATWKWIFWILAILAASVTIAGYFIIPVPPIQTISTTGVKAAVDWIGGTLITLGLLALMFALTEGNVVGWSTSWVPVLIVISVVLIVLFVLWQWYLEKKTTRRPLMKVSIWNNMKFSAAMITMTLFFASFNNYLIFVTYFFQDYLGLSVIQTTLRFIPTGVCGVMVAFVTANILSRIRGNYILMFGTLCVGISALLFAVPIPPNTTYWAYGFPAMCLAVFGADTLYPSLTLFTAHSLPQEDQALGGALINAVGQVGRAIGLAIGTAVETAVIAHKKGTTVSNVGNGEAIRPGDASLLSGLRAAEWLNFGFAITAFAVVLFAFRGAGKLGGKH